MNTVGLCCKISCDTFRDKFMSLIRLLTFKLPVYCSDWVAFFPVFGTRLGSGKFDWNLTKLIFNRSLMTEFGERIGQVI